jgi:uncharacterized repeat protein (TIGR03803 family)
MKAKSLQPILRWAAVITASLILMSAAQAVNQYKVLHYFGNRPARYPRAGLVADAAGNLYGTTASGSSGGKKCGGSCGVVFKLTRGSGGTWGYSVIYRFHYTDGSSPMSSLIFDSSGNLYGTTVAGGTYGMGTVFELSPSGSIWKHQVLYSFGATSNDLGYPEVGVVLDASGNLYGTASTGEGGVFELKRSGNQWQETVIYKENSQHFGSLVWDSAGNLYGTTSYGGTNGQGDVFELTPSSGGGWTSSVLYSFAGGADGIAPYRSGVVFDAAGNLYGTTGLGGLKSCKPQAGCGTVFQLTPSMGRWTHSVLHAFNGSDGRSPEGGVVLDSAGNVYGTTQDGGHQHQGVVFKLSRSGNSWIETMLHFFNARNGANPEAGLIFDQQGILYGTAGYGGIGGRYGYGVIFSITP